MHQRNVSHSRQRSSPERLTLMAPMRTSEIRHKKITHTVMRQYDIFISYNRNDSTRANQFARELEKRGVRVWMDKLNLAPGELWQTEIADALAYARGIAVL